MKKSILLSSYSFGPRQGSETGIGWATAITLSEYYHVHVVCAGHYRKHFEDRDFAEMKERGIEAVFHEATECLWSLEKVPDGERTYYTLWQKSARRVYEEIVKTHQPVLAHHVTWSNGRTPTELVGLGIPVILGPTGGFEAGYLPLSRSMGLRASFFEFIRTSMISLSRRSRTLKRMYPKIDLVLAANPESERALRALGAANLEVMSNAGVFTENVELMQQQKQQMVRTDTCFTMLFVGRLNNWKGEELAIRAAAALPDRNWKLILVGSGRNLERCRQLAHQLGVSDRVELVGSMPQSQVWAKYAESDLFVFPSLHDSGGSAVIEAMGAGLPILCLDLGGPAYYVNDTCGTKIQPGKPASVIQALMRAMDHYRNHPDLLKAQGTAAANRCMEKLTWESRGIRMKELYQEILNRH